MLIFIDSSPVFTFKLHVPAALFPKCSDEGPGLLPFGAGGRKDMSSVSIFVSFFFFCRQAAKRHHLNLLVGYPNPSLLHHGPRYSQSRHAPHDSKTSPVFFLPPAAIIPHLMSKQADYLSGQIFCNLGPVRSRVQSEE
jgi:hypothetical protein